MRCNKGLPSHEGWKCEGIPERDASFSVSVWTGLGQAYLELKNKHAHLFLSRLALSVGSLGGETTAPLPFPSQEC